MARNIFKQSLSFFFVFFFSFLFSYHGKAQTSISGTINSYIDVTGIIDTDELTVSNASAFNPGDTVLLIQMKGLAIINENTGAFGSRQETYSAGKYEIIIIASISGNDITLASDMTNSYDPNGHTQMVRIPGYDNATVTGDLTCPVWDSISGTGGVIALIVGNKLSLEADIDVTGKGFAGAQPYTTLNVLCTTTTNNYYFPASSDSAGYKGEGIASYALNDANPLNGIYAKGRGAYFNGGGGGNGMYSGGGGGANGGSGGSGGYQLETCGSGSVGGIGGRSITTIGDYATGNRIFMGGGGGASTQRNEGDGTAGGNGGGIIIILADTIIGNGHNIKANGQTVVDITNNTGGAGGGGAGGTILLDIKGYKGSTLNIQASGGNGGSGPASGNCTGPGGGGGGGIVWYSQAVLAAEISLGINGGVAGGGNCTLHGMSGGNIGVNVAYLKVPLTGFLFNSIFSIQSEALDDTLCEGDILPELLGTDPRGGTTPYEYKWESSNDNSTWIIDLNYGAGGKDYNPLSVMIDTTYYRRKVKDSSVPVIEDISKAVRIIVQPKIEQNSLNFDTIICLNQIPNTIIPEFSSPIGGDGTYFYLWEQSTDADGMVFSDAPNVNDTDTYQPPVLSVAQTYYYRRTVYSGKCSHISDTVTVTVLPSISNNTISKDQTICEDSVFRSLYGVVPADGDGAYTYKWIESINGNTWDNAYGPDAGLNYSPDTTSLKFPGTLFFKRVVYSGLSDCCVDTSNQVTLIEWFKLGSNFINTDQVICEGDDPEAISGLNPTGGNGVYNYQWQEKNGAAAWSDIGPDVANYDPSNLSDTTFYRRVVDSDGCTTNTSNIDTIPVHPAIINNDIFTLGGLTDTTICESALPNFLAGIQPGGAIGTYSYFWKESTDGGSSWSTAGGTNSNIDYAPGNLANTTFYKREVFSGACTDMSEKIDINVLPALGNNSISTDQTICYNTIPAIIDGVLPTGGNSVYTYQWEESTYNIVWSPASGTNDLQNYQPGALIIPKFYRRVIFSGAVDCCSDTSNVGLITIDSLPTPAEAGADQLLSSYAKETLLEGNVPLVGVGEWTKLPGESESIIEAPFESGTRVSNLISGEYKFVWTITNGVCPEESDVVKITINRLFIPSGFSPNGDDINQFFEVRGITNIPNELIILNSGGNEVYRQKNYQNDWDGTYKTGEDLPDGTYYYIFYIYDTDKPKEESGFVVIKR